MAKIVSVVSVVSLLVVTPAVAQVRPDDDRSRGLQLGPLTLRPSVELANVGVDTNILRESEDPKRDGVATLRTLVDGFMRIRPLRLAATSNIGFDYFHRYENQRSLNREYEFRADLPFHRVGFYGSGTFVNARERFNYEIEERVRRIGRTTTAGTTVRITPLTSVGLDARHADIDFAEDEAIGDTSLQSVLKHRADRLRAWASLSLTRLTTVVLHAELEQDRFASAPNRDADSVRIVPGLEFKPGAAIAGRVFLGYREFNPKDNQFPAFRGLIGSVDTSWTVAGIRVGFTVDRELEYSYQVTYPMYVLTAVRGSMLKRVAEQWEIEARVGRQMLAYQSMGSSIPPTSDTVVSPTDQGWRSGVGVVYHLSRHFRIRGDAEHLNRHSDLEGRLLVTRATASILYDFSR